MQGYERKTETPIVIKYCHLQTGETHYMNRLTASHHNKSPYMSTTPLIT